MSGDTERGRSHYGDWHRSRDNGNRYRSRDNGNRNGGGNHSEQHWRYLNRGWDHNHSQRFRDGQHAEHRYRHAGRDHSSGIDGQSDPERQHIGGYARHGQHGDELPTKVVSVSTVD